MKFPVVDGARCAVAFAVLWTVAVGAQSASGRQMVQAAYQQKRVATMRVDLKMTIGEGSRQWLRTATLESRQGPIGTQAQRFTFRSPPDLEGSSVLTVEDGGSDPAQWVYIPAYHTSRRIAASQRGEAYLGTDYFYEDVLDRRWDEYRYQELGAETTAGKTVTKVEAIPATESLKRISPYSRTVYYVDAEQKVIVREEYYDKAGKLLKRLTNAALKPYGHYLLWDEATMENVQTGHKTTSWMTRRDVDVRLSEDLFTVRALKRPH